jgi:NADH dehydrogenase
MLDEDGSELVARHTIRYDYLVIAVGSVTNDFGIAGVAENCLFLDDRAGPTAFATACSTIACACRAR